jgi:hypothetical protein
MGFFDRQQTVADPGYNRWLFPPAALAVHLSIGQVYAFSVFKLPLTKIIGVTKSEPGDWSWSVAGVLGPVLVNYIREYLKGRGASGVGLYAPTMYLMAGLLVIGLICNLSVRPLNERYYIHGQNRKP